jgi:hypothetical protein
MRYFVVVSEGKMDLRELALGKVNCAILFTREEVLDLLRRMKAMANDKPLKIYEAELTINETSMGDKP